MATPEEQYAKVTAANKRDAGDGKGGKFGSRGLKVGGKMYAMLSKGVFVVKLPEDRVTERFVESGKGQRFDPGHGKLQKEWFAVKGVGANWLALAKEARAFVQGA